MDVTGRTTNTQNFQNNIKDSAYRNNDLGNATSGLIKEGKKVANELYEEGRHRVGEIQESIRSYSDRLVRHVHERPMSTLLIAAGVGFILAAILRRH